MAYLYLVSYLRPFFATQSFLLVLAGYFRWQVVLAGVRGRELMGDLYCPFDSENGSTFLLLFLLVGCQFLLWRSNQSKLLWWLSLTGMMVLFYSCNPWGNPGFVLMWGVTLGMGVLFFRERFIPAQRPGWAVAISVVLALVFSVPLWINLDKFVYFIDQV